MTTPVSGFHPDDFKKDQVMRRLRAKAIQLWGLQESDIDNLDPIVELLLGACSVEFERTAHEIHSSQARVLQRLANLMVPEVFTNARPAHAILHARAEMPVVSIKPEDQFSLEKEVQDENKLIKLPILFSPVNTFKLFDATLICQATGNKITFYETPLTRGENISAEGRQALPAFSMWLGIKMNRKIESLKGMFFHFDWKNEPDKVKFLPLLSVSKASSEESLLRLKPGFEIKKKEGLSEFEAMAELEGHVLQLYQNNFLTVSEDVKPSTFNNYPAEFEKVFSADQLKKLEEELWWVRFSFPEGISMTAINDVYCSINCFPVMNRKLHFSNRPYALSSKLNIIPLQTDDHYLSIKRVYAQTREYRSVSLKKMRDVEDGSYSIRQGGVGRFDQRNAGSLLNYLYDMLRDESAAFSAFGNYAIATEIKSLEQSLTRLEMHLMQKLIHQSSRSHLLMHTKEPEDVWVEFWSTQGETANRILPGKKPNLLTSANLKKESLLLMNTTSGGKEPMSDAEKLHAYKFTLLTRTRVVTEEDIKAACFSELGNKIQKVAIKKGFKKDPTAQKGFVRTLDVVLTPSEGFEEINWNEACAELHSFLERRKMFLTKIQVYTQITSAEYAG